MAGQSWVGCTKNKKTQTRGWVMGARYVDLGTSVPFRPVHGAQMHPKFQVSPDVEIGQFLVDNEHRFASPRWSPEERQRMAERLTPISQRGGQHSGESFNLSNTSSEGFYGSLQLWPPLPE